MAGDQQISQQLGCSEESAERLWGPWSLLRGVRVIFPEVPQLGPGVE